MTSVFPHVSPVACLLSTVYWSTALLTLISCSTSPSPTFSVLRTLSTLTLLHAHGVIEEVDSPIDNAENHNGVPFSGCLIWRYHHFPLSSAIQGSRRMHPSSQHHPLTIPLPSMGYRINLLVLSANHLLPIWFPSNKYIMLAEGRPYLLQSPMYGDHALERMKTLPQCHHQFPNVCQPFCYAFGSWTTERFATSYSPDSMIT